ncbi:MAG: PAS domain S-box protein [Spirochaetia bacterium]
MEYQNCESILLVEDEGLVSFSQKKALEKFGYSIKTVYSGEEAIETIHNDRNIQLVLMDIDLGEGMDGIDTAERILASRDLPIVFLSSHTDPTIIQKTDRVTSYGYIPKTAGASVQNTTIKMAFRLFLEKKKVQKQKDELEQANKLLEKSEEEQRALAEFAMDIAALHRDSDFFTAILSKLNALLPVRFSAYFQFNRENQSLNLNSYLADDQIVDEIENIYGMKIEDIELPLPDNVYKDIVDGKDIFCTKELSLLSFGSIPLNAGSALKERFGISQFCVIALSDKSETRLLGTIVFALTAGVKPPAKDFLLSLINMISLALRRKKTEDALTESEQRFKELAEMLPDVVFELDLDGKITYGNKAAFTVMGYTKEDFITGIRAEQMVIPEHRNAVLENFQRLVHGEISGLVEYTGLRKDGSTFPIAVNTVPIIEEGQIVGFRGIIINTSKLKAAEEKLRNTLQEKDSLLRELQHRVKNTFSMITSMINLRIRSQKGRTAEALKEIAERVNALAELYVLLYESGSPDNIDLKEYCSKLFSSMNRTSAAFSIQAELDSVFVSIKSAATIGLIITEVITNSVKYGLTGSGQNTITVALKSFSGTAELEISDTGPGFPEEFQPEKAESMGLKLVYMLAQQLDAEIEMYNQQGACTKLKFNIQQ